MGQPRFLRLLRVQDGEKVLLDGELAVLSGHDSVEVQKKDDSVDVILELRPPKANARKSTAKKK